MTTTDPQRLADALDDTVRGWAATTGQTPPSGLFCGQAHPWDDATLCRRLDGHGGVHAADTDNCWNETEENP